MLKPAEVKAEEARKKARELFQRDRAKDVEIVKERERAFDAQSAKIAKLKAVRLARDAVQQAAAAEAAEAAPPVKKPAKKKARKAD
jgi:hypothetical protein